MRVQTSGSERAFRAVNYLFLALLAIITLFPFYYVAMLSLGDPKPSLFFVVKVHVLHVHHYKAVFSEWGFRRALLISIARVVVGVALMVVITGSAAFVLTKKNLKLRTPVIVFFLGAMFFSGGLIPTFMTLKTLGLLNSFWVLVLPSAFSIWTMIVMKMSFQSLPASMVEMARVDGAHYVFIFFRIVLPLSKPMLAVLSTFHAVDLWNEWFAGAIYISNRKLKPLQTLLQSAIEGSSIATPRESAYVVVSILPMVCLYAFIQKHLSKSMLVGATKA